MTFDAFELEEMLDNASALSRKATEEFAFAVIGLIKGEITIEEMRFMNNDNLDRLEGTK